MEGNEGDVWRRLLRDARRQLRHTQRQLAEVSGVAVETIRSYENGKRRPSRRHLVALLDVMRVDRGTRNVILEDAGFAPDGIRLRSQRDDLNYSIDEAAAEIERYPWPAFVVNEYMELIAANRTMLLVWDVDPAAEFPTAPERNLLTAATNPRFADRCLSWDETVGAMAAAFKGHHRGSEDPSSPGPYFQRVVEVLMRYDPAYFARIMELWERVEPLAPKLRWSYPVVWQHPGAGVMRFICFASSANEPDGLSFNDWIPIDAETWLNLERLRATGAGAK